MVDQARLLEHCALVVSHAGSCTFLGALARGLPQLCLPQAADQFRNAAADDRAGAALVLHSSAVTPTATSDAVGRLLSEDHFRNATRSIAAEIQAMPSPDEVVANLANSHFANPQGRPPT